MKTPINQIDFEYIDWKCLDECTVNGMQSDNQSKIQLLINKVCETVDLSVVNTQCVKSNKTLVDLLNSIFLKLCAVSPTINVEEDYSKIMLCGTDNWTTNKDATCFTIADNCNVTTTEFGLIQALVKRVNTLSAIAKQQQTTINELSATYNGLQAQITTLSSKIKNCCP